MKFFLRSASEAKLQRGIPLALLVSIYPQELISLVALKNIYIKIHHNEFFFQIMFFLAMKVLGAVSFHVFTFRYY